MKEEPIFSINTKKYGKLVHCLTLVFYDHPRTFICEDESPLKQKYIFNEYCDEENKIGWYISPILEKDFIHISQCQNQSDINQILEDLPIYNYRIIDSSSVIEEDMKPFKIINGKSVLLKC